MLNLDIPESAYSAASTPIITCTIEGILEAADLSALATSEAPALEAEDPRDLKRIREKHHSIARMIAAGMSQRLTASIVNMTESYLSILLNNPAMQELVELYRVRNGAAAELIGEKLRSVALKAVDVLDDKLSDPEKAAKMNTFELTAAAKLGLDRSGHGPASKHHVVSEHHLVDHAELARLNQRAREGSRELIVPVEAVRHALTARPDLEADSADD